MQHQLKLHKSKLAQDMQASASASRGWPKPGDTQHHSRPKLRPQRAAASSQHCPCATSEWQHGHRELRSFQHVLPGRCQAMPSQCGKQSSSTKRSIRKGARASGMLCAQSCKNAGALGRGCRSFCRQGTLAEDFPRATRAAARCQHATAAARRRRHRRWPLHDRKAMAAARPAPAVPPRCRRRTRSAGRRGLRRAAAGACRRSAGSAGTAGQPWPPARVALTAEPELDVTLLAVHLG